MHSYVKWQVRLAALVGIAVLVLAVVAALPERHSVSKGQMLRKRELVREKRAEQRRHTGSHYQYWPFVPCW